MPLEAVAEAIACLKRKEIVRDRIDADDEPRGGGGNGGGMIRGRSYKDEFRRDE
jgi:hypothetical protein